MPRCPVSHIKSLSPEWLRGQLAWELEQKNALIDAFRDLPDVPPIPAQHLLFWLSDGGRDWARGKELQRKHGYQMIPPKYECEAGAGLWSLLREALKKREVGQ